MEALQARLYLKQALNAHGLSEAEALRQAELIIAHLLKIKPSQILLHANADIDMSALSYILTERLADIPLQYILGEAAFMNIVLDIEPGVLIPRADTEIIVEKAIDLLQDYPNPQIADICTGSGAIALSLADALKTAQIWALDISHTALHISRKNALKLGFNQRCTIIEGDLCAPLIEQNLAFDLIISNPPYINAKEMAALSADVRKEPSLALFGGEDGLDIYHKLIPQAALCLKDKGYLLLEHGDKQQEQVAQILTANGYQIIEVLDDYGRRARGIVAQKG